MDAATADERFRPAPEQRGLARASTTPWYRPVDVVSAAGTLSVTLKVDYASLTLGADPVRLRSYNGVLAGPTLRAKPGDTLKIKLVNALPANLGAGGHTNNTLHEYNTTNLHTHGLHVSPSGNSDNVLLDVLPGTTQDYEIQVPANHPAGTFWYHAHRHGSVAAQVSSGMSGALIIEGGMDAVPEVAATKGDHDRVVLLQQIPYVIPPGETEGVIEEGIGEFGPGTWNSSSRFTTVNGVVLPVIQLKPGEVERWRFVDSGFRERLDLRLVRDSGSGPAALNFHEIAADGIPLGKLNTTPGIELWPGYRSDALVQAPMVEGVYLLIDEAVPASQTMTGDGKNRRYLAKFNVSGTPNPMSLPTSASLTAFRPPSIPAAAATGTQTATYGIDPVGSSVEFHIDGKSYDPASPPRTLSLGNVDEWTIRAVNGVGPVTHPFHIHVNPFEIFSIKDAAGVEQLTEPIWRDTVAMKPGQTIRFRTRYADFTGDFVQHCHILDHEDQGMMQRVRIAPPARPVSAGAFGKSPNKQQGLREVKGEPQVLVFVKGSFCAHCMSQIATLDRQLAGRGVKVSVITASGDEDLARFPKVSFDRVADPELKLFKQHGAFDGQAKHATIVRDRRGNEVLRKVGDTPFTDTGAVLTALRLADPVFAIAVANTDTVDDDYVTWAPTPCRIRITNPMAGGADVTVTLTNNSVVNPDAGQVRFAATLAAGKTATDATLTLTVKGDGTPTDFFIAGSKASTLTAASMADKGRDAVIEIHNGNVAGPVVGRHAVMVRVRKDFATLNALERRALQTAIAQLHTAPPGGDDFYLLMLNIHSLSVKSPGMPHYPNQAHNGPAFLAWHRAYILRFERELQKLDPTVSLHYWRMNQQPGPGLPAAVFDVQSWGTNTIGPGIGPVTFDAANSLFGWQINGEALSRNRRDRGGITDFDLESSVLNYEKYRDDDTGDAFSEKLEIGNHNTGHGWVGSWMADCQRSPRDPIFWLFHCDLDRSWALWQATKGRFGTTGANVNDYMPNDAYTAGSFNAKGHHLKDTMWPWDGVFGTGAPGDPSSDRPPSAPGGMFPKALLPGIWPPAAAKPRPADVIDYLGIEDRVHNLGFSYDMVPFGTIAAPPVKPLAAKASLDAAAPWTERRAAVQALNPRKPEAKAKLLDVLNSAKSDDALRVEALHRLVRAGAAEGFDAALAIVHDPHNGGHSLHVAAVYALGEMCMFGRVIAARHHDAEAALAEVVKSGEVPLRRAAIETLAVMQAPDASALLREQLDSKTPWLSPAEAISLLKVAAPRAAETAAALRRHVDSRNPTTQALAILGLQGDTASRTRRLEVLLDTDAPPDVRGAALESLMYTDPGFPDAALRVALDPAGDLELRRKSVAGLAVYARGNAVSKEKLAAWVGQLRHLESAPQKALRATATPVIQSLEKLAASR